MYYTEKCLQGQTMSSNRATCESGKIFSFEGTIDVQVVTINNEPWFVAVDVCHALFLQNSTNILQKTLEQDEYLPYTVYRSGQKRTVNVVSESGLYTLIFQSRKPNAKKFRKWVTSEVLPSIRKTGYYGVKTENIVSIHDYQHLKMMYSVEKQLRELLQKQRDHYANEINYYVNERDDWRNRALERNDRLMKLITEMV